MTSSIVTRVLQRLAETVETSIVPELASDYAAQQARATAALLRVLAPLVELGQAALADDNARMRQVLVLALADLGTAAAGATLHERLHAHLADAAAATDANAANVALKHALTALIEDFATVRAVAGETASVALEHELHVVLRHQIDGGASHWAGTLAS